MHSQARGGVDRAGDVEEVEVGAREHRGDGVCAVPRLDDDPHELGVDEAEGVRQRRQRWHLERGGGGRGDGNDGPCGPRVNVRGAALRVLDSGEDAVCLEEPVGAGTRARRAAQWG